MGMKKAIGLVVVAVLVGCGGGVDETPKQTADAEAVVETPNIDAGDASDVDACIQVIGPMDDQIHCLVPPSH